jgi:hypothetical protein
MIRGQEAGFLGIKKQEAGFLGTKKQASLLSRSRLL